MNVQFVKVEMFDGILNVTEQIGGRVVGDCFGAAPLGNDVWSIYFDGASGENHFTVMAGRENATRLINAFESFYATGLCN